MPLVLIIAKVIPEPLSSAAGVRILQIIDLLKEHGWKIAMASEAKPNEFSVPLEKLGISFYPIELNSSSFNSFIRDLNPQLVLFDRFSTEEQYGWRVLEHCPSAIRLLDTEDLHGLRTGRELALNENRSFQTKDLFNPVAFREIASIYRCHLSLIISEFEMELLYKLFQVPPKLLMYIPFLLRPNEIPVQVKNSDFSTRHGFVSIGNFLHSPNLDTVNYLHQTIWPLIRKRLPEAELFVYGAYVNHSILKLNQPEMGFYIKGRAENAGSVMKKARVCLAPLRFGAGLKGKLMDAMLNGTPSVCSGIAAEGMRGAEDWPGSVEDEPEKFAEAAVNLYTNENKWQSAVQKISQVLHRFNREHFSEKFGANLDKLMLENETGVLGSFTEAMIRSQGFKSNKYFSLYIETKNKLKRETGA